MAHSIARSLFRPAGGTLVEVRWLLRLGASGVLVAGLLVAPAAQARTAAAPTLLVEFYPDGLITVTLPDGTPVGSTSGSPTLIPAGYYTVLMSGPGGCVQLPLFDLRGPGASIVSDMNGGEVDASSFNAYFLPNSTYTWRTDRGLSSAVHTFATSSSVAGSVGVQSGTTTTSSAGKPTSDDIVGSDVAPYRGTLTGVVSAGGRLTVAFNGKSVTTLKPGRYTISVTDRSSSSGFLLQKAKQKATSITGAAFIGKHSAKVDLTAGTWIVTPRPGQTTFSLVVKS